MRSKKPEMAISLLCFYCDMRYTVFKLYDMQMVTLKPFCILDGSVAMTFHSAHIIYSVIQKDGLNFICHLGEEPVPVVGGMA